MAPAEDESKAERYAKSNFFEPSAKLVKAEGHCLCGRVKYQLDGPYVYNVLCHCENCRHATGSAFLCATIFPRTSFKLLQGDDDLKSYSDTWTESTQPLTRQFCSNCGSQLFARTPLSPDIVSVFAGNWIKQLDDWVPMREQFCAQRVAGDWLDLSVLNDGVVRTKTNPMSEVIDGSGGDGGGKKTSSI